MQLWGAGLGVGEALLKFNGWFPTVFSREKELLSVPAVESHVGVA
jgi:hypothetical protein